MGAATRRDGAGDSGCESFNAGLVEVLREETFHRGVVARKSLECGGGFSTHDGEGFVMRIFSSEHAHIGTFVLSEVFATFVG